MRGKGGKTLLTSGKIIDIGSKIILVDGENSGEVFNVPCRGYMGSTFKIIGMSRHVNEQYLKINLDYNKELFRENKTGSAIPHLNKQLFRTLLIGLPPLAEQERVVKRVEELFAYIDTIDDNQAELEKLYDDLKKRVLDLAIQGKLVPQEPTDEPASILLEKMRAEKKAKLGKKYVEGFIYKGDDNCYYEHIDGVAEDKSVEVPFDLPDGWEWTRVQDYVFQVTDFVASGSFATLRENVRYYKEENYALLVKTQDFANNFTKDLTYTDRKGYEFLSNSNIFGGELILSNVGSIGKVFIVPKMNRPATLAPNSIMVRCAHSIPVVWLYFLFQSPFGLQSLLTISSATAIQKFNKTDFKLLFIPIPPLAEQQRIVDKINEIFANL